MTACTKSCPTLDCLDEINTHTLQYLADEELLPQRVNKRRRGKSGRNSPWPNSSQNSDVICSAHHSTDGKPLKITRLILPNDVITPGTSTKDDELDLINLTDGKGESTGKIRCNDCMSSNTQNDTCEMCLLLQTLAMDIDIPQKAQPSYCRAKWYMATGGKLQARTSFLR